MNLLALAVRNVTRHPRRVALSMLAVVIGTAVLIVGQAAIDGFEDNTVRTQIDLVSGHVMARAPDYPTTGLDHPLTALWTPDDAVGAWLDAQDVAWTTRTLFVAEAVAGADAMPVRAIALTEDDAAVFPRATWTLDGTTDGLVVSTGVAALLDLDVGDDLVLRAHTVAGAQNAVPERVSGVFATGSPMLDRFGVLMTPAAADRLLAQGDAVSHLHVRLPSRADTVAFADALAVHLPGRDVVTWEAEAAPVLAVQTVRRAALDLVVLALLGISATGIANTVLMAAFERTREIGTLAALGMTRLDLAGLFVLEGATIGSLGAVGGALLGGAIVAWYGTHGIELPLALATSGNLPMSKLLFLRASWQGTVVAFTVGLGTATVASAYPAWVAARLTPAEALR
jgi:putative ABC transport system permease protein